MNKCKYCLKPLDENGFCTKCKMGLLIKRIAELKEKIADSKSQD